MRRKPPDIFYGVDESPSAPKLILYGVQHFAILAGGIAMPLLVCEQANAGPQETLSVISVTMLAWALGGFLQILPKGPLGSGYLALPNSSGVYLGPALEAARMGGLPLVAGMTVVAGFLHALFSPFLRPLRRILTPELSGLVLMHVGFDLTQAGFLKVFHLGVSAEHLGVIACLIGCACFLAMLFLTVWSPGKWGTVCVLVGLLAGDLASIALGVVPAHRFHDMAQAPLLYLPSLAVAGYSFKADLLIAFLLSGAISTVKTFGVISAAQKGNDADWRRPDVGNASRGSLADGVGSILAGIFGTMGQNISTSTVGVSLQTGVTSRKVGLTACVLTFLLAFSPKIGTFLLSIPFPVLGAVLLYTGLTVFGSGLKLVTQRPIDTRRALLIGLPLTLGLVKHSSPQHFESLPAWIVPLTNSDYEITALAMIALTLIMKPTNTKAKEFVFYPDKGKPEQEIRTELLKMAGEWNIRKDVLSQSRKTLNEIVHHIAGLGLTDGQVAVIFSFDDYGLDMRLRYKGKPVEFEEKGKICTLEAVPAPCSDYCGVKCRAGEVVVLCRYEF